MFKKLFDLSNDESQKQKNQTVELQHEDTFHGSTYEFNPDTFHGIHYLETDFDNEVERRAETWIAKEKLDGYHLNDSDVKNIYTNYRREVYREWNNADADQLVKFEMANSFEYNGIAISGFVKTDDSTPMLEPIHGISLQDYSTICAKLGNGIPVEILCKALGIETTIWEEVSQKWVERMQQDSTFTVTTLMGQYFSEAKEHPVLGNINAEISTDGNENLEKLKNDVYFYHELTGARQAAYEYGLDGAQWIVENFGISLGDFQQVAMKWMEERNKNWNSNDILHYHNYQEEKQKEYASKFATEQGGNIADDVEF